MCVNKYYIILLYTCAHTHIHVLFTLCFYLICISESESKYIVSHMNLYITSVCIHGRRTEENVHNSPVNCEHFDWIQPLNLFPHMLKQETYYCNLECRCWDVFAGWGCGSRSIYEFDCGSGWCPFGEASCYSNCQVSERCNVHGYVYLCMHGISPPIASVYIYLIHNCSARIGALERICASVFMTLICTGCHCVHWQCTDCSAGTYITQPCGSDWSFLTRKVSQPRLCAAVRDNTPTALEHE